MNQVVPVKGLLDDSRFRLLRLGVFLLNLVVALNLRDSVLFSDEAVQLQNLRALAGWFDQAVQPFVSEWEHPMPNLLFLLTYAPLQLLHTWDLIRPATVVLNCLMIEAAAHLLLQVLRQCEPNTKTPKASASLLYSLCTRAPSSITAA